MSDQLTALKMQAAETAGSLAGKVKRFEAGLKEQAESTRKIAQNLFGEASSTPRAAGAALKFQIREHPVAALSVAGLLGFATTYWFDKTWAPAIKHVAKELKPELKKMREATLSLMAKAASSQLKDAYPIIAGKLTSVLVDKLSEGTSGEPTTKSKKAKNEEETIDAPSDFNSSQPI